MHDVVSYAVIHMSACRSSPVKMLQLVASGAWKGSSENHNGEVNCLDSWTGLSVKIPVAGLTPFPSDAKSQESWAEQVVATPVTMATLGQGLANATVTELQAKYDAAYTGMGAKVAGMFTQGMINSGESGAQHFLLQGIPLLLPAHCAPAPCPVCAAHLQWPNLLPLHVAHLQTLCAC